jgi:hypothetical protein
MEVLSIVKMLRDDGGTYQIFQPQLLLPKLLLQPALFAIDTTKPVEEAIVGTT